MAEINFKPFKASTANLQGSNLVEASAGTGKTYSIAILALRLLLEKQLQLKEILMVTFTNDAVAELQIRIRKFVREAYKYAKYHIDIDNDDIKDIVDSNGKEASKVLLEKAIQQLDEMSIITIHSFCQNILTEFAFETGQGYNLKLLEDLSEVRADMVKDFWREEVSKIDKCDLIKLIGDFPKYKIFKDWFSYFDLGVFKDALKNKLENKKLNKNTFEFDFNKSIEDNETEVEEEIKNIIIREKEGYVNRINTYEAPGYANGTRNNYIVKLDDEREFVNFLLKTSARHARAIFEQEIKLFKELRKKKNSVKYNFFNRLMETLFKSKETEIVQLLHSLNQVSFDDLIENLHRSIVTNKNEKLINLLRVRYQAVFVDEFQDTDKFQYEIFNTVFNNDFNILFYIGDPKQSIYGWRKADINTYFNARSAVANCYTMNTNFRSTSRLIDGLNEIFSETDYHKDDSKGIGVFSNEKESTEDKQIIYHRVDASKSTETRACHIDGTYEKPIVIFNGYNNKPNIYIDTANHVQHLLSKGVIKGKDDKEQPIQASDIAILVRSGYDGKEIKNNLDALGIPSILIDDSKIFSVPEAKDILYALQAMQEPSPSNINKALLSKLTGYLRSNVEKLNLNFHIERAKKYFKQFNNKGVYAALVSFYEDYQTRKNLLGSYDAIEKSGLKSYSNVMQLAEALQRLQNERGYELNGIIAFLKRAIEGEEIQGNEYERRLETDEQAIQIVTIHKSKGLQYNIVIAPFLDLEVKSKGAFSSFRNQDGTYLFEPNYNKPEANNPEFIIQSEQENRRLVYVALTRAKYQLYLFTQGKGSIGELLKEKQNSAYLKTMPYESHEITYEPKNTFVEHLNFAEPEVFELKDKDWLKMSFSFLSLPHATVKKNFDNDNEGYDYFIFKELERGAHVGNMLHAIFEFIDFTNDEKWDKTIDINLKKYNPKKQELYRPQIPSFLNQILNTTIEINNASPFKLSEILNTKRINELEFDLKIDEMHLSKLYDLQTENVMLSFKNVNLKGMLNGFIDLFFEHDNKYYVLDWKSNYLGDTLEDYTPTKLNDAMNESNYHLQYFLYTMAAKRFLESKIRYFDYEKQFGGVIYVFLRGVRKDSNTGIFTTKLPLETVNKLENIFCLNTVT
ncbi:UvrD-helicase domain-containing protein [Polaribacter litorisediminis]|uniref:UvrD-helicase domain-containing protein n=1 Tax=Polaribacter litorisediminis TaxID=1908341 RepID=UPI001CBE1727|nr:UvrD-helicase domain-containing protein [Polaribacter litorisediminis]UAM97281.1 UvrD-helicase domain-containing protein [Polaribacter litorisediminis]